MKHLALHHTYKQHPVYEDLLVSYLGYIYNQTTDKLYNWDNDIDGYRFIRYRGKSKSVHILVAETHVPKPNNPENLKLIVNHRDGIKANNKASNLEWTTYSGNSIHAYVAGLWPNTKPILCKNIKTNEVTRFYSLSECARHFQVNNSKVHSNLNAKSKTIWMNDFILIYENEEWPTDVSDVKSNKCVFKKPVGLVRKAVPITVKDLETGIESEYESTQTLANELGVKKNTLQKHIWVNNGVWRNTLKIKYECNCP